MIQWYKDILELYYMLKEFKILDKILNVKSYDKAINFINDNLSLYKQDINNLPDSLTIDNKIFLVSGYILNSKNDLNNEIVVSDEQYLMLLLKSQNIDINLRIRLKNTSDFTNILLRVDFNEEEIHGIQSIICNDFSYKSTLKVNTYPLRKSGEILDKEFNNGVSITIVRESLGYKHLRDSEIYIQSHGKSMNSYSRDRQLLKDLRSVATTFLESKDLSDINTFYAKSYFYRSISKDKKLDNKNKNVINFFNNIKNNKKYFDFLSDLIGTTELNNFFNIENYVSTKHEYYYNKDHSTSIYFENMFSNKPIKTFLNFTVNNLNFSLSEKEIYINSKPYINNVLIDEHHLVKSIDFSYEIPYYELTKDYHKYFSSKDNYYNYSKLLRKISKDTNIYITSITNLNKSLIETLDLYNLSDDINYLEKIKSPIDYFLSKTKIKKIVSDNVLNKKNKKMECK